MRLSRSISLRSSWATAFASGYARSPHPPGGVIRRRAAPTPTLCPDMRMHEAYLRRRLQGSCSLPERHVRRMISRPPMAPGAPALRPRRLRSPRRQMHKGRACFAAALLLGWITSYDAELGGYSPTLNRTTIPTSIVQHVSLIRTTVTQSQRRGRRAAYGDAPRPFNRRRACQKCCRDQ